MFVRTERLFLRPGWPEDLDDLIEAFSDEQVQRTVAVRMLPRTREAVREYLARPRDPRLPHFFMYLRGAHGARLVGGIGLGKSGDDVEVGYWIASGYRGRGYALEALRAVVDQARALGYHRLIAKHFVDSNASVRVLEAAGFQDTGTEHLRYSAARGEEAPAHLFVIDLDRRKAGADEQSGIALSA
ncbi:GNAT family N-acetyltransferase [Novosphingobium album (ex Hu et al. 2023)]|uniref:GNAT family N-acetyltransferase n=1 Tax=Novosphingobium album (ex Hu et al. 2023) TaxID=2930093 RepID=A0ABT0B0J3_9SPHN|nr:GNAT family N-acetyltransferase [Novosphingobium album (ex Hu et al. 2023)]MCJ2178535.1 GNAT family N-acetyltransferase [Novosphingobium album (ex Hu et al. 2023)]